MPSEILATKLYIPDCKISLVSFVRHLNRGFSIPGDFPKGPPTVTVSDRKFDLRILGRRLRQVRL